MKSEKNGKPLAFTGEELETMHDHSGDDRLLFLLLRLTGASAGRGSWSDLGRSFF